MDAALDENALLDADFRDMPKALCSMKFLGAQKQMNEKDGSIGKISIQEKERIKNLVDSLDNLEKEG